MAEAALQWAGENPTRALEGSRSLLHDVLRCNICNDLMLDPYTASCGHTFCGPCLAHWFDLRQGRMSCPACRARVTSKPVPAIALRQLAYAVVKAYELATGSKVDIPDDNGCDSKGHKKELFENLAFGGAIWDDEEEIYRCPRCSHEIAEGICSGCGLEYPEADPDWDDSDVEGEGLMSVHAAESEDLEEEPDSEDIAFIDDDDMGYDSASGEDEDEEEPRPRWGYHSGQRPNNRSPVVIDLTEEDGEDRAPAPRRTMVVGDSDDEGDAANSDDIQIGPVRARTIIDDDSE